MSRIIISAMLMIFFVVMNGCSIITKEYRLSPKPEEYANSLYKASVREYEYLVVKHRIPKKVHVSGDYPELVLESNDYRITLSTSVQNSRTLAVGPCIIIPLPVIPVLFLREASPGNEVIAGSITSRTGIPFSLGKLRAIIGSDEYEPLNFLSKDVTYRYSGSDGMKEGEEKMQRMEEQTVSFLAEVPVSKQIVKHMDVNLSILEKGGKEVLFPVVHFYSSSGIVWDLCVL